MATGPREKQKRWAETNSSSKNLYARKVLNKPHNSRDIPQLQQFSTGENNSPEPSPKAFDTVASDNSSSLNRVQPVVPSQNNRNGAESSLPGYVQFDNKVRISLNTGSKSVIRKLKRKLVSELDRVRSLKSKLEATEFHYNNAGLMNNVAGSCSNKVGTLARVNSEVSYVGPTDSRPMKGLARAISVDGISKNYDHGSVGEKVDKVKETPKVNQHQQNLESGIGKKQKVSNSDSKKWKPDSEGKKGSMGKLIEKESGKDKNTREMLKKCGVLLEKLMKHQYGWVFNKPVDVKKLNLHDYHKIIKHPMDLGTVNNRLKRNWYKSPIRFAEDVRLTFNNAKTYNEKGQDVHIMADVLLKLFEEKWAVLEAECHNDERFEMGDDSSIRPLTSKKNQAPRPAPAPAPAPSSASPPLKKPSETRILDRAGVMTNTKLVGSNMKTSKFVTDEGKTELSKMPKEKEPQRREMTFKEKQILSINLQSLPSDKLGSVVQIIKKRNPGLCQQEDEIELDIDCVDFETLWELDTLVSNHMKDSGKNMRESEPEFQRRVEVGHNLRDTNLTSTADQALQESDAAEQIVRRSPIVREEQDNINRSCSSGSSSGGFRSSSDSDSSSGYCSDTGR